MKDSFILYTEYAEHMKLLNMEQRGILFTAIFAHEMGDDLPEMDAGVAMAFSFIRAALDRNSAKYDEVREKRKSAGVASGKARAAKVEQKGTNGTHVKSVEQTEQEGTKRTVYVNDNVNVNVNDNDKDSIGAKTKRFRPPTVQEVEEYAREKGYSVDAERFVDFYESKGWVVGRAKMKDWKAAVRNWARDKKPAKQGKLVNYDQRQIDYDSLLGIGG